MKRTFQFLALVALCCSMMVSCKNNKTTEPTPEEIQVQKQALADTVLAMVDEIAEQYWDKSSNSFRLRTLELTDAEKAVKPDYLLEPSVANTLVTREQKINALAIFVTEQGIRKIYDMPCDEVEEVIARLIADIDFPNNNDLLTDTPVSEKIKAYYEACKKRGDLELFWRYEDAVGTEINYLLVQNLDLFFSKITEEQWQSYYNSRTFCFKAVDELAKYDEDMASLQKFMRKEWAYRNDYESSRIDYSFASAKEFRLSRKDLYIAKRNALLQ